LTSQLQETTPLSDLIKIDGEIGQPRLRQSCGQLYVVLDRRAHLLIVLILRGSIDEVVGRIRQLRLKVESLLADAMDELEQMLESAGLPVELDAFVLLPDMDPCSAGDLKDLLPLDQVVFADAICDFPHRIVQVDEPIQSKDFDRLSSLLFPKRQWKRVQLVRDEGRKARHESRVEMDQQLIQASWGLNAATTLIEGGPGTGKSLLLSSRARWLTEAFPDAVIALVTWNKSLADALEHWLAELGADTGRIQVMPIADFLKQQQVELDLADPVDADKRCLQLLQRGHFTASYDAILVDEAQDLGGALLELVLKFLKPNRGGLTIALDSSQNIRNRPPIETGYLPVPLETISLTQCHRSTANIRSFAHRLRTSGAAPVPVHEDCQEEPVRLVWAESSEQCIAMIVHESRRLIADVGLLPHEIMVVTFEGHQRRQIVKAFQEQGITTASPGSVASAGGGIRIASPEVAKGHEASCVFVVGWDSPGLSSDTRVQAARRFVAASRACDLLYMVYTSQDGGLIMSDSDAGVLKQLWPDDFEVALQRQD
jgi:superfamily I DNA/RNA helicase